MAKKIRRSPDGPNLLPLPEGDEPEREVEPELCPEEEDNGRNLLLLLGAVDPELDIMHIFHT